MLSQIIAMGEDQNKTKNQGQIIIYVSPKHIAPRFFFGGGSLLIAFALPFYRLRELKVYLNTLLPECTLFHWHTFDCWVPIVISWSNIYLQTWPQMRFWTIFLDFVIKDLLKQLLPCSSIIMKGAWSTVTTLYTVVALNPAMEFIIPGEYEILLPHSQLPISFLYSSRCCQNQWRTNIEYLI